MFPAVRCVPQVVEVVGEVDDGSLRCQAAEAVQMRKIARPCQQDQVEAFRSALEDVVHRGDLGLAENLNATGSH